MHAKFDENFITYCIQGDFAYISSHTKILLAT